MPVRVGQLIAIATLIAGCAFDRDYGGSELRCTEDGRCPEGFSCIDNRCVGGAVDAGVADSSVPDAAPLTVCERAAMADDNDICADAIDITVDIASPGGAIFFGDTTGYANHINPAIIVNCTDSPEPGNDAMYTFDANAGQTLDVTLATEDAWNGAIYLLDDCSSSATCLGGDDGMSGELDHATIPIPTTGRYYLIVDANLVASFGCYTLTASLL